MVVQSNQIGVDSGAGLKILTTVLLMIILTGLVIAAIYLAYVNIPGKPEMLNINLEKSVEPTLPTNQFYQNMKFNHNDISYSIGLNCADEKKQRVLEAFEEISMKVSEISFFPVSLNPDIRVSCSFEDKEALDEDYFIAGEGGAKEIIQTGDYNVITHGVILLYEESKNAKKCDWPNVEIHELMHVFGFDHSEDENSLMFPFLESCSQKLDLSITNKLKQLYSEENLAELYFDDISAMRKGKYLDFNMTVKNSGTIDSSNISLTILDDGDLVETRDIGKIRYGGGISLRITNLKLLHRDPDEITFILNRDNSVKEKNNENNIVKVKVN